MMMGQYRYSKSSASTGSYFGATFEVGVTSFYGDLGEGAAQGDISNNLVYKIMFSKNIKSIVIFIGNLS